MAPNHLPSLDDYLATRSQDSTGRKARGSTLPSLDDYLARRPVTPHEWPEGDPHYGDKPVAEEPRSFFAERFPKIRQALYGVVDSGLRLGEGLTQNAANVLPGNDPFQRASDLMERQGLGLEERTAPTTTGETLARVAGNIVGEGAQYMVGGAAGRKLVGPMVRAVGEQVAPRLTARLATSTRPIVEVAKDAAAVAPLDLVATAVGPENSTLGAIAALTKSRYPRLSGVLQKGAENPATRFAGEVLIGGSADVVLRGAGKAAGRLRGSVPEARRRVAEMVDPEMARQLREAYHDTDLDIPNKKAWEGARARIEADPNTEIVALDAIGLKASNDVIGREAGDELLRRVATAGREAAINSGVDPRNIFRVGGDEIAIAVPVGRGEEIGRAIKAAIGEGRVGNTEYPTGVRYGVGPDYNAADAAAQVAKKSEVGPRYRSFAAPADEGIPVSAEISAPVQPEVPFAIRTPKKLKGPRSTAPTLRKGRKVEGLEALDTELERIRSARTDEEYRKSLGREIGVGLAEDRVARLGMEPPTIRALPAQAGGPRLAGPAGPGPLALPSPSRAANEAGATLPEITGAVARTGVGALVGGAAASGEGGMTPGEGALAGAVALGAGPAVLKRLAGSAGKVPGLARRATEDAARALDLTRPGGEGMAEFLTKTPEARLRDETLRMVEKVGKRTVTWAETREVAQGLGLDIADIDTKRLGRLNGAEMLAVRNVVSTNLERIAGIGRELADATLSDEARRKLTDQIGLLDGENAALLSRFAKSRTAAGRNLNNLKILANHTMDKTVWLSRAQDLLGGELDAEQRAMIVGLADANDRIGLVTYLRKLRPSTWSEKAMTLRKAGLLTSPTTHMANVIGNTTMQALEAASNPAAVVWDALIRTSYNTGRETKSLMSGRQVKAAWDGAVAGVADAKRAMRGEISAQDLLKYDVRQTNFNTETRAGAFAQKYTDLIFRSLDAEDRLFRGVAFRRSLAEQAEALAKTSGRDGWDTVADALFASPTDEMVLRAISDAEFATFRDRSSLAKLASGIRRVARDIGPEAEAVFDLIAPFTTTPANVATRVAEYSPLGFLGAGMDARKLRKAMAEGGDVFSAQKNVSEALGRATVGTAAIGLGMYLAANGKLTGEYPINDTEERNNWELTGKIPQAVLIGDSWRSLQRISPFGNLIALGGEMYRAKSKEGMSADDLAVALPAAVASTTMSMSFLQGVTQALDAIKDPERSAAQFGRSLAGSFVPTLAGRVARAVDPVMREGTTTGQVLRGKIPGLRGNLPARYDALGDARRTQGGPGEVFDPMSSSRDRRVDDYLISEIDRVGANVAAYRPSSLNDELLGLDFKRGTQDYADVAQFYGERVRAVLESIVVSRTYQAMPDEDKKELLEDAAGRVKSYITRAYKARARARQRPQLSQPND